MSWMLQTLVAGDTLSVTLAASDIPAGTWTGASLVLVPRFTTPTQAPVTIAGVASSSDWVFSASAATTAAWKAGSYGWSAFVTGTGTRATADSGQIVVTADPTAAAAGADTRSQAQVALDAIDAVLANRATLDQQAYTINGRSLQRMAIAELLQLRGHYAKQVAREQGPAGAGRIYVRLANG